MSELIELLKWGLGMYLAFGVLSLVVVGLFMVAMFRR